jgi:hypothetical protein
VLFTTYHPLLVESHYSVLLCLFMLGDFAALLRAFVRAATVVDGLEGYPIFLPPRSMAQVEFVETLERLAGGWRVGVQPHSRARARPGNGNNSARNGKLAIEAPPLRSPSPLVPSSPHSPAPVGAALHPEPETGRSFDPLSPSTSSSATRSSSTPTPSLAPPTPSGRATPSPSPAPALHGNVDLVEALDCARIILAPVAERQRSRAEQNALEKRKPASSPSSPSSSSSSAYGDAALNKGKGRHMPINIPLHGPRVEVVLAWVAAVWLVELEGVALALSSESGDGC